MNLKQCVSEDSIIKKANTWLNNLETRMMRPFLISYPQTVFIEVTNDCNLSCSMCARRHWDNRKNRIGYIEFSLVEKMRSFLKHAEVAVLHGHGEPLLATHLWDIAAFCYRYGCKTLFHTNGILLHEEYRKRVMAYKINEIRLSVDGGSEETVKRFRGSSFEQAMDNFSRLSALRHSVNSRIPFMGLCVTLMKDNIAEIPELIVRCAAEKFNFLYLQHLNVYDENLKDQSMFLWPELMKEYTEIINEYGKKYNIRIIWPDLSGKCRQLFQSVVIRWNGDVRYCCSAIFDNEKYSFSGGSLFNHTLRHLWNSESAMSARAGFKSGVLQDVCAQCSFITGNYQAHIRGLE